MLRTPSTSHTMTNMHPAIASSNDPSPAPTPTPTSPSSHPPTRPSPANRLHFASSHPSAANAARHSIMSSSAKGWSPLQINKRDAMHPPSKAADPAAATSRTPSHGEAASPRRTSNSFKHVTRNSLVSNSPFKSPCMVQGQQAAGIYVEPGTSDKTIHEKRSSSLSRPLGQSPEKAQGSAATPKAAIGLGISANRPRSTGRTPSGSSGSAVGGTRKVSHERGKVLYQPIIGERKGSVSGYGLSPGSAERQVLGNRENDSPDAKWGKKTPRSSMGLKGLARNEYVSKSPFLSSTRRVPSGETTPGSPAGPSPKCVPVEKDDVFSSPSPRRVSGGKRKMSPSPNTLGSSTKASVSPTPSPPRGMAQPLAPSAGPSPLGQPSTVAPPRDVTTPTPTPVRSSMTPSRRLRGPRDLSDPSLDSPSKTKTVTFQAIPDVKEFDPTSTEASADGSFDMGEEQWDDRRDESMDDFSTEGGDDSIGSIDSAGRLRVTNPDTSPDMSENGNDESTTAEFVNTLIEEGLFSPPQMETPAFEEQAAFELPLEAPVLATPSLGGSVHVTPMLASMELKHGERDSASVPYGRTHHSQRAGMTHSSTPKASQPVQQPNIPTNVDHQMLFNANAAQPALQYTTPFDTIPTAHQNGPMPDPFITIQTATKVLSPERTKSEDGAPLGRTSHTERMQAARMLATQSLGLGMPRSPAIPRDLTHATSLDQIARASTPKKGAKEQKSDKETEVLFDVNFAQRKVSDVPEMRGPSKIVQWRESQERAPKKGMRPPQPQQLDLPSPVSSPKREAEQEKRVSRLCSWCKVVAHEIW